MLIVNTARVVVTVMLARAGALHSRRDRPCGNLNLKTHRTASVNSLISSRDKKKKKKKWKPFSRPSQLFKGFPPQEEHITEDERGVLFISHVRLLAVIAVSMWHGEKSIIIKNMKMQGQLPEQPVTVSSQNTSKTPASADDDLSSRKKGVFPQRGGNANVSFLRARLRDTRYIQRP